MGEPETRSIPRHGKLAILAVPMLAFAIASNVGNALAPTLIANEPGLLLVLSPRLRWLLLMSAEVNVLAFYAVPLARAAALLGVYFLLGRWYGDRSVRWLEDRARNTVRPLLWMERKFHRARYPMVFAFPGTLLAVLAGADGIALPVYLAVALTSIALRLVLVRYLASVFQGPLGDVLDWISEHQLWLTGASMAIVFGWVLWSNRHGSAPIESIDELAAELEVAGDEIDAERDGL
jgi:membrane protein DedA with SNARE-associated domain